MTDANVTIISKYQKIMYAELNKEIVAQRKVGNHTRNFLKLLRVVPLTGSCQ